VSFSKRWISDARLLLEVARARSGGPVFVVGGLNEARLTLYSQQCRALNLVCAVREQDPQLADKKVVVVGAGAAGMTAATALRAMGLPGSQLTVFERAASPLYTQRASYTRFLHPRLFHWPDAGWDDPAAALPVAGWRADYAAAARGLILDRCVPLPIKFCTDVRRLTAAGTAVEVAYRRLGDLDDRRMTADLVFVTTGFPAEQHLPGTLSGTYWHGLQGLDDLAGDVHVVGDGDGALTEVLMMLIDRFGHAAVERLCELLPLERIDDLNAADLEAQGDPLACADPTRRDVESARIRMIFEALAGAGPRRRTISIHAVRPLSGGSFLLNRALVSHLRWMRRPVLKVVGGRRVDPANPTSIGKQVIWRAGVDGVPSPVLAEARLTTKGLNNSLKPTTAVSRLEAGLVTGLLDGLRRPMWTSSAERRLQQGRRIAGASWRDPDTGRLLRVSARPTRAADELLRVLVATEADLLKLGLRWEDAVEHEGKRWVGIDVLARAGSVQHADLVHSVPVSPPASVRDMLATRGRRGLPDTGVRRDEHGRLWFRLPHEPGEDQPRRGAVCAMVSPRAVRGWAAEQSRRSVRDDRRPPDARVVDRDVLRGLGDVALADVQVQSLLAKLHEQRGDLAAVRAAYVRAGRRPGGARLGSARRRATEQPDVNTQFRRVQLDLAGAVRRMLPDGSRAADHAVWLLLSAAAADLVTLNSTEPGLLELTTTASYLRGTWAPRVRRVLTPPGRRRPDLDYVAVPGWAAELARAAVDLGPRSRDEARVAPVDHIPPLANAAARTAEAEAPDEPLVTLADLGVWPVGTMLDHELRGAMRD
jgi:hypothetical protein